MVLFLGLVFLLVRLAVTSPGGSLGRLKEARPLPVAAGLALYVLALAARGVRLNLLLPRGERLPLARAASVSGAQVFLLQVLPFRGGEAAGWALFRRELGVSWTRAGAVWALLKIVDSSACLLTGLAGAAGLLAERGDAGLGGGAAVLAAGGALGLLLLPRLGASLARGLAARSTRDSRIGRGATEIAEALDVARSRPALYLAAVAGGFVFMAGHVAALWLLMRGLGATAGWAAIAFATLASSLASSVIPSPAGTFGPMESGFAAGLAATGVPLARGAALGAVLHLLTAAVAGLAALPVFVSPAERPSPISSNAAR